MPQHIALLRGINVGKAKRIAMADLRRLLSDLGHTNVRTLLNSGNAVFQTTSRSPAKLAQTIEKEISRSLQLEVPIVVVTAKELDAIIAANPLLQAATDPSRFLVAFVQRRQDLAPAAELISGSWEPEAFALGEQAAYLWCADGVIKSRVAKAFARATGDAATTRNWATVLKLQAMLSRNAD